MKRLFAGTLLMLAAIAVQLAMVIGLLEPSIALGLAGYVGLFVGMALVMVAIATAYALSPGRVRQVASVRKKTREESRQMLVAANERA